MYKSYRILIIFVVSVFLFTACSSGSTQPGQGTAGNQADDDSDTSVDIFADIGGESAGGIVFDDKGIMYVAKEGKEIVKITPDGKFSTLCSLKNLPEGEVKSDPHMSFKSPFIWDMVIGRDNNIYAAAQDRILKISMDGKVTTLIKENFGGLFGASGIEVDDKGNIYVTDGEIINKYTPSLKKQILIDGNKIQVDDDFPLTYAFSLKFDSGNKNLYIGNRGPDGILKLPLGPDEKPGNVSIITQQTFSCPHTLAFDSKNNIYACPGHSGLVLKVDQTGKQKFLIAGTEIDNGAFAFGKGSFGDNNLYITSLTSGKIYRFNPESKNVKATDDSFIF